MKIRPTLAFHHAGTTGPSLDPRKEYPCEPATNQPDYEEKGLIFVPFDPEDTEIDGDNILLERGDYTVCIDPDALYWASFNRFEMRIPGAAALDCSASGANDEAVAHWTPKIRAQVESDGFKNAPTAEAIRLELKEYGAWDAEELADEDQNWQRLVWCACHNIKEEENPDCSEPVK